MPSSTIAVRDVSVRDLVATLKNPLPIDDYQRNPSDIPAPESLCSEADGGFNSSAESAQSHIDRDSDDDAAGEDKRPCRGGHVEMTFELTDSAPETEKGPDVQQEREGLRKGGKDLHAPVNVETSAATITVGEFNEVAAGPVRNATEKDQDDPAAKGENDEDSAGPVDKEIDQKPSPHPDYVTADADKVVLEEQQAPVKNFQTRAQRRGALTENQ